MERQRSSPQPRATPDRCRGHKALLQRFDAAVLAAYGFDATKDLLAQLLELNVTVAALEKQAKPVTARGVPPSYPNPQKLVTEDCIRP